MQRFLPTSKNKDSQPWYKKNKKKEVSNNLPFPQVDNYQRYYQMMEKNGLNGFYPNYPSAPYPSPNYPVPMPRNNQTVTMTTNNERAIIPRQDDSNTHDIVTIEQHQDRVNRELADLENGRGGGQA